jgi:hypothetical protein
MEPHEKAKAGVWLLKQAILDVLRERGALQPHEVENALGMGRKLGWELLRDMAEQGEAVKGEGRHPTYSLPRSPQ